jgi:acetyl esterase/lipase
MRLTAIGLGMLLIIGLATIGRTAADPSAQTIDLWPGSPPGDSDDDRKAIGEEEAKAKGDGPVTSLTKVTKPTIKIFRPDKEKANGVAIVVCPGGGYNNLAWDHEGEQVGRWLNTIGVTAAVLKYRVPRRPDTPKDQPPPQALMDAQRALSLVRSKADDWGLDPKKVGILGFSAGGHLSAWASTNSDKRAYDAIDAADRGSCRPDFAVVIYPGGVVKRGTDQLTPQIRVTSETPPMFLAQSHDDRVNSENSIALYLALKRAGVPAELHIYSTGGHGYGMRPSDQPYASWPRRCEEWLRTQGILKPAADR